jgi:hypothetical protein
MRTAADPTGRSPESNAAFTSDGEGQKKKTLTRLGKGLAFNDSPGALGSERGLETIVAAEPETPLPTFST